MKLPLACLAAAIGLLTAGLAPLAQTEDDQAMLTATWRGVSLTEFDAAQNKAFGWEIVNDGVMGGLSKGQLEFSEEGTLRFSGQLSLDNNGGFSTFRSREVDFDLSNDQGLLLRVRGDGRSYQARLNSDARYRGMQVSFMAEFPTTKGQWREVKVPFTAFAGSFRGLDLSDKILNPANIQQVGILLADKKAGPFEIEVDWIRTYGKGKGSATMTATDATPGSLVDTVVADGRFKTLATALTKAELLSVLQDKDPLTVFAPTDEAFAKLPEQVLQDLLKPGNKNKLAAILSYHVSPGASRLGDAISSQSVTTVQGADVVVAFSKGKVRVNDAAIVDADLECSNGVIHVIDSVLLPPEPKKKTVLTVAEEAGTFSTLLAAIGAADLESVLEGDGPFTIFAPTEKAFASLPEGTVESLLKKENRKQLAALLTYHVVSGRVSAGDALNAGEAKTMQGGALKFGVSGGLLKVNESTIRSIDLDGGNGVIHVIDSVLLPLKASKDSATVKTVSASTDNAACNSCDATETIASAIEKGVPLFNSGNPAACADVYQNCIEILAADEKIDGRIQHMLTAVMKRGENHDSATDRAWLYRRTLDGMVTYLDWSKRQGRGE